MIPLRTLRVTREIPVGAIRVDRMPFERVLSLVDFLRKGGKVPPIRVQKLSNGQYRILDGRHRWMAHKLLTRPTILATYAEL